MFLARPPGCAREQVTTKKRGGPGTSLIAAGPAWLQSNDASGHDQRRRSPAGPWRTWRVVSRSGCRYCSEVSFLWLVSGFRPSIAFDWRLAAGYSPPVINESSSVFSKGGGRREWHVSAARPNKDGLAFDWQRTFLRPSCHGLQRRLHPRARRTDHLKAPRSGAGGDGMMR